MNRIDRLVGIVLFLQGRRVSRAEDIAGHFETSLRTVYRDIAALGEAGVPIVSEAGVGYSLLKGYHLPPVTFTPDEAGAIATGAVLVAHMTDPSLSGPMQSALLKIRAVLPREQQERVERVERATLLQQPSVDSRGHNTAHLVQIQDALARRRILRLGYRASEACEATHRDVEPLGLVHYLQRWHVIAWCRLREDIRDFRLDRIQKITVLAECFAPRDGFSFEDYRQRMSISPGQVIIRVRFAKWSVERARREWVLGVIHEEPVENGTILTLSGGAHWWFVGWLLSFGTNASILEPPELREQVARAADEAANHHRRT
ncbi:MAG TPA: YafY family protein [Candidatus Limnocylindria bacterium]|jgi:predicted DNA-binding transcriptional regulator YafY|nr:YafY family protein [Candidatus Limnocylindria bacterium]